MTTNVSVKEMRALVIGGELTVAGLWIKGQLSQEKLVVRAEAVNNSQALVLSRQDLAELIGMGEIQREGVLILSEEDLDKVETERELRELAECRRCYQTVDE
jgi:hypothetical protein